MKTIYTLLIALSFSLLTYGQDSEWTLYSSEDGVEVYKKEINCDANAIPAQKAIVIKVVNTTSNRIKIEWDKEIWYNNKKVENTSDDEKHETITLKPNETKEGSCEVPRGALYIYKDFITYDTDTKLTNFELLNLKVVKL